MPNGKYYYYGTSKLRNKSQIEKCIVVSEKPLPRGIKTSGGCVIFFGNKNWITKKFLNQTFDIAIGDPKVCKDVKLISLSMKDVPEEFWGMRSKTSKKILTFEWQGAKLWVLQRWVRIHGPQK